jgi:hypothetical protein
MHVNLYASSSHSRRKQALREVVRRSVVPGLISLLPARLHWEIRPWEVLILHHHRRDYNHLPTEKGGVSTSTVK